jgi:hypothetical protein
MSWRERFVRSPTRCWMHCRRITCDYSARPPTPTPRGFGKPGRHGAMRRPSISARQRNGGTATKRAWSRAAVIVAADWRALFGLTLSGRWSRAIEWRGSTFSGPSRPRPWTPQLGGKRAYSGRLEKDRSPRQSRHSIASRNGLHRLFATFAAPPTGDPQVKFPFPEFPTAFDPSGRTPSLIKACRPAERRGSASYASPIITKEISRCRAITD